MVQVPAGFSGFWCERCEKLVTGIPEEAGTPAKCPHCRKWTVVWVAPSGAATLEPEAAPYVKRERLDPARAAELFVELKASTLGPEDF